MKKLIALAMVMSSFVAMAVSSSNIFGILRVDSTAEETLISVPWLETDPASGEIKVCDLVLTSNLTVGDRLLFYTGTAPVSNSPQQDFRYLGWTLVEENGVKKWQHVTTVDKDATGKTRMTESAHDGNQPVPRGAALFVIRPTNHTDPIYLYGQYTPGTVTSTVTKGTFAQPAYTLLAPSNPNGVKLNEVTMTGTPDLNDYIVIGNVATMLKFYDSRMGGPADGKWGVIGSYNRTNKTYEFDDSEAVIKPGQGVWYVSRGGSPTFTW